MTTKGSLILSRCLTAAFALALLLTDVLCWHFIPLWFGGEHFARYIVPSLCLICALSVPAWFALWGLWQLLMSLGRGEVFTAANIRRMRLISWCCFAVTGIALCGWVCMQPMNGLMPLEQVVLLLLPAASALMGLIVRIVKNVFEQAALMKDELDYTV